METVIMHSIASQTDDITTFFRCSADQTGRWLEYIDDDDDERRKRSHYNYVLSQLSLRKSKWEWYCNQIILTCMIQMIKVSIICNCLWQNEMIVTNTELDGTIQGCSNDASSLHLWKIQCFNTAYINCNKPFMNEWMNEWMKTNTCC